VLEARAVKDRIEQVVGYAVSQIPRTIDERSSQHPLSWWNKYDVTPISWQVEGPPYHKVVAKRLE